MNYKLLLLVALFGVVSCAPRRKKMGGDLGILDIRGKRLSYAAHASSGHGNKLGEGGDETGGDYSGGEYSGGQDLVSLVEGAAALVKSTTSSQGAAGSQAAYQATNRLAQKAVANSATAHAATASKHALVSTLQHQLHQAHQQVLAEAAQLKHAQEVAHDAHQVAKHASFQVAALSSALHNAQATADQAQNAADVAASEAASQAAMLNRAQHRLSTISEHLSAAQAHLAATRQAAHKAAQVALTAQTTANQHVDDVHGSTIEDNGEVYDGYEGAR